MSDPSFSQRLLAPFHDLFGAVGHEEIANRPHIPRAALGALLTFLIVGGALVWAGEQNYPALHAILDTAMCLMSGLLALLLWDMGARLDRSFLKWLAIAFAATSALEFIHVVVTVEWTGALSGVHRAASDLRPLTWPPATNVLPLGVAGALWLLHRRARKVAWFALAAFGVAALLLLLYQQVTPYSPPSVLAITRPSLVPAALLWAGITWFAWRMRDEDRALPSIALMALTLFVANAVMLYSRAPHDEAAMIAHLGKVSAYISFVLALMYMASLDMAERIRAEARLARSNEELEERVVERTSELAVVNTKAEAQLGRLTLLHQISRAIGERQDLASIFQVAVRSVEDQLPADFVCLCRYDRADNALFVACVGAKSAPLALSLAMPESARIEIDQNGLSRCVAGRLVYEPDIFASRFPFPERLARGGLRSFVAAPLQVESQVYGALIVARTSTDAFVSGECEFLRQLSEHVALASNQTELVAALQAAYDELRLTQDAVMQQERLRALGQMASGIAHDINNALSPISLYTESILTMDHDLSQVSRGKLEVVQRAIDDAAHTVSRMKDFYRQGETQLALVPVRVEMLFQQVLDLTKSRWKDMPLERGLVIEVRTDMAPALPAVLGVESELREALINLVFNAVDALPDGGKVTLRAQARGQAVQIDIADDGVGMDEATRQRCLEPFFTTKGERGTGLGLASVYGVVQRHGGELEVITAVGEGTCMRLTLAAAPIGVTAPTAPVQDVFLGPAPRMRVLLIDDDPILLRSLRDVLSNDGHVVEAAGDGAAGVVAFRYALVEDKGFDVVITDLGMPKLDGRRVAAAIKEMSPTTPVFLLTGWGERLMAEEAPPPHIDRILSKPPKLRELRAALSQCGARGAAA
jgi:signal transduction histidine kinase/ActR/RegA family two-component response regulator